MSHINEYKHPERWRRLWHQYFLGTIGSGLALGDVDGDGLADIFYAGKDTPHRLYINQGDLRFVEDAAQRGIPEHNGIGAGAAMVDIDNDGDLDIYVTYTGFPNELYINQGKGVFRESATDWGLAVETGSNAPSFSDYDLDGDLDLYLQCNFLTDSGDGEGMADLLLENQEGTFVDVTEKAGISGRGQGHVALWWDFDDDGWPDLYVANDFESADRLYRNNKDGTFSDVLRDRLPTSPYSAMGADVGDLDNDGVAELLVAEMATRDPVKHQRTVATIETKSIYAPRRSASQYMQNMLSVKIGREQFTEVSRWAGLNATDWTWAVRFADFDNDGLQDAFFTNGMVRAFHDGDLGRKSEKAKTGWQRIAYYKSSPRYDERNLFYRNRGDFQFEEMGEAVGLGKLGVSFAASLADLDLDGDLDLVVANMDEPLSLLENRFAVGSSLSIKLVGKKANRFGLGARLRLFAEGQIFARELVSTRGYLSTDEPVVHFGLGKVEAIDRLEIDWPGGGRQVVCGLYPGYRYTIEEGSFDPKDDQPQETVFVASSIRIPSKAKSWEEPFKLHPKQMLLPEDESRLGPPIALADLDGDGYCDIALGGPCGLETRILWNRAGVEFEAFDYELLSDVFDAEDVDLLLTDLDGDQRYELIVSSGGIELDAGDEAYVDRVYAFSGDRKLKRVALAGAEFSPSPTRKTVAIDYDGDGDFDLLQAGGTRLKAYPHHEPNLVWRKDGDSYALDLQSEFASSFATSGNTTDLLVVDWTGDGKVDLVQSLQWGAPLFWKLEDSGLEPVLNAFPAAQMLGAWSSLSCGDFDGDGRLDIVMGNRGENLTHVPSVEDPLVLFAPKGPETENRYIECFSHGGRLLPVESRFLHSAQFPGLLERTTSSVEDYANKEVAEIFPTEVLSAFSRFEMNDTKSGVLFQKSPEVFEWIALPRWAQSGEVKDSLVCDYDGDGWDDIVLSLQPRAPKLWVDRPLKGHLVLLRNERGKGFRTLLPRESGLEIDGYPRHLAWKDLDGDGREELILTMSGGMPLVFSTKTD
ncbi:VCBS repeat-containing protein [Pelagicoccus sp. SDUM812005]|uniref:VCBS repeat-containing protein n=1 Tax=Pelagicoccus sp. SDUM812005 TaxID=3041257 RepID=UPI00280D65F1|nr:VCBS repeat-containing protein [Pelagicoccus sp. SDUM812005]MDQ8182988.1 VCBS repeat-containing protein [Pelagicoccus sp. SDUM812005]